MTADPLHTPRRRWDWLRREGRVARRGLGLLPRTVVALAGRGRVATGRRRVVPRALAALVPALVAFLAVALGIFVGFSGYLYPIRPDVVEAIGHPFTADSALENAWGGPTLMGAWLVHALVALAIQIVVLVLVRGLTGVWERLLPPIPATANGKVTDG